MGHGQLTVPDDRTGSRSGWAKGGRRRSSALPHLLLSAPAALVYIALLVLPVLLMVYYSFTHWDGVTIFPEFIGVENYRKVFSDAAALSAMWVTIKFTLFSGAIANLVGLSVALLVNRPDKMSLTYRLALFVPVTLSSVVVGILWKVIFNYYGTVNSVLASLGREPADLLGSPTQALWLIVGAAVWQTLGLTMMIYLAGLQSVPGELIEAAHIDGANKWQNFRHVVLPLLAPVITMNILIMLILGIKQYDLVRVITGGGPARATQTVAFKVIEDGLTFGDYGPALALAVLLMVASGALALIIMRVRRDQDGSAS